MRSTRPATPELTAPRGHRLPRLSAPLAETRPQVTSASRPWSGPSPERVGQCGWPLGPDRAIPKLDSIMDRADAKRRIAELESELAIVKRASALFDEGRVVRPKAVFDIVETLAREGHGTKRVCRLLRVAPSGFFRWRAVPRSDRSIRRAWLADVIVEIHDQSRRTYGWRRVRAELADVYGQRVNKKLIRAIMAEGPSAACRGAARVSPAWCTGLRAWIRSTGLPPRQSEPVGDDRHHRAPHPRKASSTAASCSTPGPGGLWAGRWIGGPLRRACGRRWPLPSAALTIAAGEPWYTATTVR
jgi:hypothetical protein